MGHPLTVPPPGFDDLAVEEQIDYVQELWSRIAARQREVTSPAWHRDEVRAALKAHRENPASARPWDEVRAELEAKHAR